MYCMQCSLKSKYIKNRTFNDKNRWIIKRVMVFKKLFQHLATRGTYSPGVWRCDEAWREQTLVYPPVMCQQRLIYCTWEFNVMIISKCIVVHDYIYLRCWMISKCIVMYDYTVSTSLEGSNIYTLCILIDFHRKFGIVAVDDEIDKQHQLLNQTRKRAHHHVRFWSHKKSWKYICQSDFTYWN